MARLVSDYETGLESGAAVNPPAWKETVSISGSFNDFESASGAWADFKITVKNDAWVSSGQHVTVRLDFSGQAEFGKDFVLIGDPDKDDPKNAGDLKVYLKAGEEKVFEFRVVNDSEAEGFTQEETTVTLTPLDNPNFEFSGYGATIKISDNDSVGPTYEELYPPVVESSTPPDSGIIYPYYGAGGGYDRFYGLSLLNAYYESMQSGVHYSVDVSYHQTMLML